MSLSFGSLCSNWVKFNSDSNPIITIMVRGESGDRERLVVAKIFKERERWPLLYLGHLSARRVCVRQFFVLKKATTVGAVNVPFFRSIWGVRFQVYSSVQINECSVYTFFRWFRYPIRPNQSALFVVLRLLKCFFRFQKSATCKALTYTVLQVTRQVCIIPVPRCLSLVFFSF